MAFIAMDESGTNDAFETRFRTSMDSFKLKPCSLSMCLDRSGPDMPLRKPPTSKRPNQPPPKWKDDFKRKADEIGPASCMNCCYLIGPICMQTSNVPNKKAVHSHLTIQSPRLTRSKP